MINGIYAVYDNVAKEIVGGLHLHKHQAAAIRMFADAASDPKTMLAQHPQDYDLVQLGTLGENNEIEPRYTNVLKGAVWHAANHPTDETKLEIQRS